MIKENTTFIRKLTPSQLLFAKKHGLTHKEMVGYIEDMEREEEMEYAFFQEQEREMRENENSPQKIYSAW